MPKRIPTLPPEQEFNTEPSAYAGQEQVYPNGKIMKTTAGHKVRIMNYIKEEGLYVVMNMDDEPETVSPAYKVSPDKLQEA